MYCPGKYQPWPFGFLVLVFRSMACLGRVPANLFFEHGLNRPCHVILIIVTVHGHSACHSEEAVRRPKNLAPVGPMKCFFEFYSGAGRGEILQYASLLSE